jgi:hypothetical protein
VAVPYTSPPAFNEPGLKVRLEYHVTDEYGAAVAAPDVSAYDCRSLPAVTRHKGKAYGRPAEIPPR